MEEKNPNLAKNGNIIDYTDLLHLIILNNLEITNSELIKLNLSQSERLKRLNESAKSQMEILKSNNIRELDFINQKDKYLVENK